MFESKSWLIRANNRFGRYQLSDSIYDNRDDRIKYKKVKVFIEGKS